MLKPRIILASGSAIRARLLADAGVPFEVRRPVVDETRLIAEALATGHPVEAVPAFLARAKALSIEAPAEAFVIGADQVLEFGGAAYEKPADMAAARVRLLAMQGRSHRLVNAVMVATGGKAAFEETGVVSLQMRRLSVSEIDAYLEAAGDEILTSVGAYQVERLGARLFHRIDGDYFTVLGLNLLPLLGFLKARGALEF